MGAPLRVVLSSVAAVLALIILTLHGADARRYYGYVYYPRHHEVTGTVPRAALQPTPIMVDTGPGPLKIPNAALEPARWSDLDGWAGDDHASAYATLAASCRPIVRSAAFRAEQSHAPARVAVPAPQPNGDSRPVRAALEQVCARAIKAGPLKGAAAREFFEANFVPVRIRKLGEAAGFLTGYYEPIVDGSRFPTREFPVPLYRRPPDLTMPGLADGALQPGYAGIRPKINGPRDPSADFVVQGPAEHGVAGLVNLYGIESPGLTASLPIADHVARLLDRA